MNEFIDKHRDRITGVISTFDRMIFKGHILPFFQMNSRHYYLFREKILMKGFGDYAKDISCAIKEHAKKIAEKEERPFIYLESSRGSKQEKAVQIRDRDKMSNGLICVFTCVEPCTAFDVRFNKESKKLEIINRDRKCLFIYFYYQHPEFGLMHVRLQTWFPFQMQIYINGREWLMKQLDRKGIGYKNYDNSIIQVDNLALAQKITERFNAVKFAVIFDSFARRLNPILPRIKKVFSTGYYWVLDQAEYATDVMFENRGDLQLIYPELVEHALLNFTAKDVMCFLGRKLTGHFAGEILTNTKDRPQGVRIKHRMKNNSIKMYDKWSVLRIETTINNPREFKIYREVERGGKKEMRWIPMGKSVFNLYRYEQVSMSANKRYLEALASFVPLQSCVEELEVFAEPMQDGDYRCCGFNPISAGTTKIFEAVLDGSHLINGFRNKDLQRKIFGNASRGKEQTKKQSSKITRIIRKLRAHKLVVKVSRTTRYKISQKGYRILGASIRLKKKDFPLTMKLVS